jgi:hypothetical protein
MQKPVAILACVAMILTGVLVYGVVDVSVSLDHAKAQQRALNSERALLRRLLLDLSRGTSKSEAMALVRQSYGSSIVKEEPNETVFVDSVGLVFRDAKLTDVVFLDDVRVGLMAR